MIMGFYLNSIDAYSLYKNEVRKPYFVDKTKLIEELIPLVFHASFVTEKDKAYYLSFLKNLLRNFKGNQEKSIFDNRVVGNGKISCS